MSSQGLPSVPTVPGRTYISPRDSWDFTELPGTQGMSLADIGIVVANLDLSDITHNIVHELL